MAATPEPIPDHPMIGKIDKAFTNAPALAGWLEYLAHPEQHDGPRLVVSRFNHDPQPSDYEEAREKPFPESGPGQSPKADTRESVLRELTIDQFFAAADVLTGQDIASIESAVTLIEEIRHRKDGKQRAQPGDLEDTKIVYDEMYSALTLLLPTWTDEAGVKFGEFYVELKSWYDSRTEHLLTVEKRLVEYAAAIETARKNLNKVMKSLVDALERHTAKDVWDDPLLPVIGNVVAFGLGKLDPTGTVALIFSELFGMALKEAEKEKKPAGLSGDSYHRILNSYLEAARDVLDKLVATTRDLASRKAVDGQPLNALRSGMPALPVLG